MLNVITDRAEIQKAQITFQKCIEDALFKRDGTYKIGYQGGYMDFTSLRANQRIWYTHMAVENISIPRHWNAFGLATQLNLNASNPIVVEINIPFEGLHRRVGGIFALDTSSKKLLLLHRGNVGGGRKGIGKKSFLKWHGQKPVKVHYNGIDGLDEAIFVAVLEEPNMANQVANFVNAVAQFKKKVEQDEIISASVEKLKQKLAASRKKPKWVTVESTTFQRNPHVVEYVKRRAAGICQLCQRDPPFKDTTGQPYLECHHVVWLSKGGQDTIENAVALCPNCHAKMHILNEDSDVSKLLDEAKKTI